MFRAIIFDMDGIIVDSEPAHVQAEKKVFKKHGVTASREDLRYFVGRTDEDVMTYIKQKYNITAEVEYLVSEKRLLYRAFRRNHLRLMDGFRELAQELFSKYPLALTTSSIKKDTDFVLEKFKLHDLFKVVVTAEDVTRTKPDPEPYARTVELLGLRPEQCVVIEDAINGLVSAREAGTATIGLASTFPAETLMEHADAVAESLSEIPQILSGLQKGRKN